MNQPRRTMTDALQSPQLPPEALALIKEGTPKPQAQTSILTETPVETSRVAISPKSVGETVPLAKAKAPKEKEPESFTLVPMNFRVPAEIPQALLKASSERKMKKIRPFTQQDIIAEALSNWLHKNGY